MKISFSSLHPFCEFFLLYRGDDTMYDVSSSSFFNWSDTINRYVKYNARE